MILMSFWDWFFPPERKSYALQIGATWSNSWKTTEASARGWQSSTAQQYPGSSVRLYVYNGGWPEGYWNQVG
jgi:hypothetical protein